MEAKFGSCLSVALDGLQGRKVETQAHICAGIPSTTIVGLPDTSLQESKDRVKAAVISSGLEWTEFKLTINLIPASIRKAGSGFDLSIAICVLSAMGKVNKKQVEKVAFLSELGLDGRLESVQGVLPAVISAKKANIKTIVVSRENEAEAKLIDGIQVLSFLHLTEVINYFGGAAPQIEIKEKPKEKTPEAENDDLDFADVLGQENAKYSMMVAAAGGHHILMVGPPGTGKTMLASRITSILPNLDFEQALEVTSIHSIYGKSLTHLIDTPQFVSPHNTATAPAIIGGGASKYMKPGAISLAHFGVLFLDEAPEFSPLVLQTLRQPLESGMITIDRVSKSVKYPARFQLIMACNPCPCGMSLNKGVHCTCTSIQKRRYFSRLSGPLIDRIDIQIIVNNISKSDMDANADSLSSREMKKRVLRAREISKERFKKTPWKLNSEIPGSYLRSMLGEKSKSVLALKDYVDKGTLSLRGMDRTLRLAWSIADLEEKGAPDLDNIDQALFYRTRIR